MTALLGATLIVTATTDVSGLPALPAICIGFLLPNADLLWTALRRRGRAPGRIYGRTDTQLYDLDADVIERTPGKIVLLTRDRPPLTAVVEGTLHGRARRAAIRLRAASRSGTRSRFASSSTTSRTGSSSCRRTRSRRTSTSPTRSSSPPTRTRSSA